MSSDLPSITANLNFFDTRLSSSLNEFRWKANTPPSERPSNTTKPDTHPVRIYDLRRLNESEQVERGFRLGKCGFEIIQGWGGGGEGVAKAWDERKWEDQEWIENEYYSYIERLVKDKLKATRTVAWDYTLRKPTYASSKSKDAPALQTHIDQTYWASIERVRLHLGTQASQKILNNSARAVICNVWRPLTGPISDLPLAFADYRTLDNERDFKDTLPAPPGCRTGESQMLRYHSDQKWYYLSGMTEDECLFLQCFDSLTGVRSPHSAFIDPSTPSDASPRWSMEVRTVSLIELEE